MRRQPKRLEPSRAVLRDPSPHDRELPRRRVLASEVNAFQRAMETLPGRFKQRFLAGLIMPWSALPEFQTTPRGYSLVAAVGLTTCQTLLPGEVEDDLIHIRAIRSKQHEGFCALDIRMTLSDVEPMWIQRFTFPELGMFDWHIAAAFREGKFAGTEGFLSFLAQDEDCKDVPVRWENWLTSCRCPANRADAEAKRTTPWTHLFFAECTVHRNLWVDDIYPTDTEVNVSLEDRLARYMAGGA
jgi:hypothetical protein